MIFERGECLLEDFNINMLDVKRHPHEQHSHLKKREKKNRSKGRQGTYFYITGSKRTLQVESKINSWMTND